MIGLKVVEMCKIGVQWVISGVIACEMWIMCGIMVWEMLIWSGNGGYWC